LTLSGKISKPNFTIAVEEFKHITKILLICDMHKILTAAFLFAALFTVLDLKAQARKIDTTATISNIGFRVSCNNKNENENEVTILPKGFSKEMRDLSFSIKGRLRKILVEDVNADGYPDLMLCVYGGVGGALGNIVAISPEGNSSWVPVRFPDIYSDPKLSDGYKGHDEFTVMVGTLMQTFPVYKSGDTDVATGGKRVIQYKLTNGENGGLAFKVLRSYQKE
jgi:hypothetical protein